MGNAKELAPEKCQPKMDNGRRMNLGNTGFAQTPDLFRGLAAGGESHEVRLHIHGKLDLIEIGTLKNGVMEFETIPLRELGIRAKELRIK